MIILSIETYKAYVGNVPQCVTFTCVYCHFKGKLSDVDEIFTLQLGLLKDNMSHSSNKKVLWETYEFSCDPYLRLDALSLAFLYRRYSDKIYDFREFNMNDCSTIFSLGRK